MRSDVEQLLDVNPATVNRILKRMVAEGLIDQDGNGEYVWKWATVSRRTRTNIPPKISFSFRKMPDEGIAAAAYYIAQQADAMARRRYSDSRSKIQIRGEELERLDELVSPLILKGQPLTHIWSEHGEELGISQKLFTLTSLFHLSIYNRAKKRIQSEQLSMQLFFETNESSSSAAVQ